MRAHAAPFAPGVTPTGLSCTSSTGAGSPVTRPGVERSLTVPSPSCPYRLPPQHATSPAAPRTAHVESTPAAICVAPSHALTVHTPPTPHDVPHAPHERASTVVFVSQPSARTPLQFAHPAAQSPGAIVQAPVASHV